MITKYPDLTGRSVTFLDEAESTVFGTVIGFSKKEENRRLLYPAYYDVVAGVGQYVLHYDDLTSEHQLDSPRDDVYTLQLVVSGATLDDILEALVDVKCEIIVKEDEVHDLDQEHKARAFRQEVRAANSKRKLLLSVDPDRARPKFQ